MAAGRHFFRMKTRGRTSWSACCACAACRAQRRSHGPWPRWRRQTHAAVELAALLRSMHQPSHPSAHACVTVTAPAALPKLAHGQRRPVSSEAAVQQGWTLWPRSPACPAPGFQQVLRSRGGRLQRMEGEGSAAAQRCSRSCGAGAPSCASCTCTEQPSPCMPVTVSSNSIRRDAPFQQFCVGNYGADTCLAAASCCDNNSSAPSAACWFSASTGCAQP